MGYLKQVAVDHGLRKSIRFGHELLSAQWDEARQKWLLQTSAGDYSCTHLVVAGGPFCDPQFPSIPGQDDFAGDSFHTVHWKHDLDLTGKRVGIIGTGATAMQVVPAIAEKVGKIHLFQRTPTWVVPRFESVRGATMRRMLKWAPGLQQAYRNLDYWVIEALAGLPQFGHPLFVKAMESIARAHLKRQVDDPELRAKLTPNFRFGCKRTVLSDAYYPALTRENVELETTGIRKVNAKGVELADGSQRELDVLVYATGFRVPHGIYERFVGAGGQRLSDMISPRPQAHLGTCMSGFPNFFVLLGPFSAAGNQSAIFMLETQARYVAKAIRKIRRQQIARLELRKEAMVEFTEEMQKFSTRTTWVNGGCSSYYQAADGSNAGLWPSWSFDYWQRALRFDLTKFETKKEAA